MDYTPLGEPVTKQEIDQLKKTTSVKFDVFSRLPWNVKISIAASVLPALMLLVVLGQQFASTGQAAVSVLLYGLIIAMVVGAIVWVMKMGQRNAIRAVKLTKFSLRNNLTAHFNVPGNANYGGKLFQWGGEKRFDQWIGANDQSFVAGNYEYATYGQKSRSTHQRTFMMVKLPRKLPHIVLDTKANDTRIFGKNISLIAQASSDLNPTQKLSLEGDFDRYFTLYAPKGYERDALYIFTPDLMLLLMNNLTTFDVEIVDDTMFFYATKSMDLTRQELWQHLMKMRDVVAAKMIQRTDYYSDQRVDNRALNTVAEQGQRLSDSTTMTRKVIGLTILALFLGLVGFVFVSVIIAGTQGG